LIEVRNEFFEKIGNRDKFDDEQIKSKIQQLRKDTKTFKDLLSSCSGYGWDPTTNTITCPSDIWSEHVAVSLGDTKSTYVLPLYISS